MSSSEQKQARERKSSERTFGKWGITSRNVAIIFSEYPNTSFSTREIYSIIRTWHLNTEGSNYSESAIRGALKRFTDKGFLKILKVGGKGSNAHYKSTKKGTDIFAEFLSYLEADRSLAKARLGLVPRRNELVQERRFEVTFHAWNEIVAFKEGWPEKKVLPTIRFQPFIIKQLRLMATRIQGTNPAGWVWVDGSDFKIRIASRQALQLYVGKSPDWKDELKEWLTTVPNLSDEHLDTIWNKIAEACNHQLVTYEFHVPDARIAAVRPDCFRESRRERWLSSNGDRIRILTPTTTSSGAPRQGRRGVCRTSLPQSSRAARYGSSLGEQVLKEAGNAYSRSGEEVPECLGYESERDQSVEVHGSEALRGARGYEESSGVLGEATIQVAVTGGVC